MCVCVCVAKWLKDLKSIKQNPVLNPLHEIQNLHCDSHLCTFVESNIISQPVNYQPNTSGNLNLYAWVLQKRCITVYINNH